MNGVPMVEPVESHRTAVGQETMSWLTLETAAYGGAVVLALALRLLLLGTWPLGPAEAAQALPALAASAGREFDVTGLSPLLFGLQRILFVVFGASDAWARAWPALLGGLAPLLFFGLRDPLGRPGALAAAYLWALSPMAVFPSRLGLGDGLVPIFALAIVSGMAWSVRQDSPRAGRLGLVAAGAALGFLLASASGAYTAILMGVSAALVWRRSLTALSDALRASWKQVGGTSLLCFALGSTFFFMVPGGLAAAADLLGNWVTALRPGVGEYQAQEIGLRLLLSEPVLLFFGLAGLVAAVRRNDRFGIFAGISLAIVLFVALIGGGRHPADLGLSVLVLTFLAGPVIARVLRAGWSCRHEVDAWLLVTVSTILLLSAALCLPGIFNPSNTASWRQLYTAVGIVTAALAGLIWLVYGVWGNWRTVALAAPLVPLLFGLVWGLGQISGTNYDRGALRQPGVLHEVPAPAWVDLQRELLDLASLHGNGRGEGRIDLVLPYTEKDSLEPVLRWALRAFPNVRMASNISLAAAPVVVALPGEQPRLGSGYSGTEIAVLQRWEPSVLPDFYSRLRWVLYREAKQPGKVQTVVLWMKRPELPELPVDAGALFNGAQSPNRMQE
jgi:hypothetical protein